MNRFDRITAILIQLQAKRVVRGPALAAQFGVSLRTVYRDLRTLEEAGVPITGEAGVGYSLADGYRLPPVMFTREEATALLTAEKLAAQLTDAHTAALNHLAMDKLRAVLRRTDRDYLEHLSPRIEVRRPPVGPPHAAAPDHHQRLLAAIATQRVVRLQYTAGYNNAATERDVEPIGLYLGLFWHLIAYCRLRQEFRDFRLDRIGQLTVLTEGFLPRPETLQQYWQQRAEQRPQQAAVVRFSATARAQVHDSKHFHGWTHEQLTPTGEVEMTLLPGDLSLLARWLLLFPGEVTVVSPPELRDQVRALAQAAYAHFAAD